MTQPCTYLKRAELVVALVNAQREVEACIAPVDYLVVPELFTVRAWVYLEEVGVFRLPLHDLPVHFDLYLSSLLLVVGDVPAGETSFPLAVL
jgi:hypothetical protein